MRPSYNPSAYDDDWEDQPAQGSFYQWILGAIVPLAILAYGISRIVTRIAEFRGRASIALHGTNAVALGCAMIGIAIFLHCHYFWGNIYNQVWFAVLGKVIGAMMFIGAMGVLIVRVGVYGIA